MANNKRERQKANREQNRLAAAEADQAAKQRRLILLGALAVIIVVVGAILMLNSGDDDATTTAAASDTSTDDTTDADADDQTDSGDCPAEDGSSPRTIDFDGPQPMCIDPDDAHVAVFGTSEGEIRVELDTADTPLTVNNFVTLARWGYYDGTTFFRTDPSIDIIQGGSPHTESPSDPGPGYTIPDEPEFSYDAASGQVFDGPYRYVPGQLVMARSAGPDAGSAQFFFTTGTRSSLLDGQGVYVVFGETDDAGLAILQGIIGLHEPGGSLGGAPSRTVTVNSVTIETS